MKKSLFLVTLFMSSTLFAGDKAYTRDEINAAVFGYENGLRPEPKTPQEHISGVAKAQISFFWSQFKSGAASTELIHSVVDAIEIYAQLGTAAGEKQPQENALAPIEMDMLYFNLVGNVQSSGLKLEGLPYSLHILTTIQSAVDPTGPIYSRIELLILKMTDQIVEITLDHLNNYKKTLNEAEQKSFNQGIAILKVLGTKRAIEGLFKIAQRSFEMGTPVALNTCQVLLEGVKNHEAKRQGEF